MNITQIYWDSYIYCYHLKQYPEAGQGNHGGSSDDKIVQETNPGTLSPNIKEMLKTFLIHVTYISV